MMISRAAVPHRPGSLGRLRALRNERGWSQHDLAEKAGVATLSVSRAENGRMPVAATVYKLAKALQVDASELYTREDDIE
jgi:transcriptional regulator with XRE-family HTH domain